MTVRSRAEQAAKGSGESGVTFGWHDQRRSYEENGIPAGFQKWTWVLTGMWEEKQGQGINSKHTRGKLAQHISHE